MRDARPSELLDLGLRAFLFDLDGVVTDTAALHAAAWKRLFDEYLAARSQGGAWTPFRLPEDYARHVDGKPRYDGVRAFLASRGIRLPDGGSSDPPDSETACGLGNRKDALFHRLLDEQGVKVLPGVERVIGLLRERGVGTACVTSSRNGRPVLARAGLESLFDTIVDGSDIAQQSLRGKPCPDSFLEAARRLGVGPGDAAVVEDAVAGVAAGRAGGFKLVLGVDRGAGRQALLAAGADLVVGDLAALLPAEDRPPGA